MVLWCGTTSSSLPCLLPPLPQFSRPSFLHPIHPRPSWVRARHLRGAEDAEDDVRGERPGWACRQGLRRSARLAVFTSIGQMLAVFTSAGQRGLLLHHNESSGSLCFDKRSALDPRRGFESRPSSPLTRCDCYLSRFCRHRHLSTEATRHFDTSALHLQSRMHAPAQR